MSTLTENEQIQAYANLRVRVRSEGIRALLLSMEDDRIAITDIFNSLNDPRLTWVDTRDDGPSHFLTKDDILAWNSFLFDVIAFMRAHPSLPNVLSACVRSLGQSSLV